MIFADIPGKHMLCSSLRNNISKQLHYSIIHGIYPLFHSHNTVILPENFTISPIRSGHHVPLRNASRGDKKRASGYAEAQVRVNLNNIFRQAEEIAGNGNLIHRFADLSAPDAIAVGGRREIAADVVCVIGAVLVINVAVTFGVIASFILYVCLLTTPMTQIAQGMANLQTAAAGARRILKGGTFPMIYGTVFFTDALPMADDLSRNAAASV